MENKKKYIYIRDGKDGETASYKQMIDCYCDNLILNNSIIQETQDIGDWELVNGETYDEENDYSYDIYQYFIIADYDAERLIENTNEIIYYNEKLDIYLLGVTHFGSSWSIVPTNLQIVTDFEKYLELTKGE